MVCLHASTQAQTLDEYLAIAAENNPGLQASYLEFEAAMQAVSQAKALPDPTISFGYFVSPVETRVGPQRAKLSLVQMFPWFGTNGKQASIREYNAQAKYFAFIDQRNVLFLQVKEAFLPLFELRQHILLKRDNLELLESYKRLATSRFSNAKGTMVDVIRVDIMIDQVLTEIKILEEKEKPMRVQFNRLLNRPDATEINIRWQVTIPSRVSLELQDSLLVDNPLIDQLDMKIEEAKASEYAAQKQGSPAFGIGIDYVFVDERTDIDVPDNGKNAFMPMVSMSLPLFRKRHRASVKEAQLQQDALVKRREQVGNELIATLVATENDLQRNLDWIELYDNQIQKSMQAIELLNTAYANSGSDFEEILSMEQQVLQYQIEKTTATKDYYLALAKMDYLTAKSQKYENK